MFSNTNLIVMCGVPGSGKSFIAEKLKEKSKNNCKILSSDAYRKVICGDENCQDKNEEIFNALYKDLIINLKLGYDVIFDATNTTLKARRKILNQLSKCNKNIHKICYVVNTPIDICIERDKNRCRNVGEEVIQKFTKSFQMPHYFEGWDEIQIHNLPTKEIIDSNFNKMDEIISKMESFNQYNPHHKYTVGAHCRNMFNYFFERDDNMIRAMAGQFHDVGKLFTQHFDEYNIAHYYSHDSIGAYYMLCNLDLFLEEDKDTFLEMLFYINYHMRAHYDFRNEKAYKKYSQIFGKERLDKLLEFADADIIASGTKDCHDEVIKNICNVEENPWN